MSTFFLRADLKEFKSPEHLFVALLSKYLGLPDTTPTEHIAGVLSKVVESIIRDPSVENTSDAALMPIEPYGLRGHLLDYTIMFRHFVQANVPPREADALSFAYVIRGVLPNDSTGSLN